MKSNTQATQQTSSFFEVALRENPEFRKQFEMYIETVRGEYKNRHFDSFGNFLADQTIEFSETKKRTVFTFKIIDKVTHEVKETGEKIFKNMGYRDAFLKGIIPFTETLIFKYL